MINPQKALFQKRHLYVALSTLWLTACSGGGTSTSNNSSTSAVTYTLNKYIADLNYVPKSSINVGTINMMPLANGTAGQESFIASRVTVLTSVQVNYFSDTACTESLNFITTLIPESPATSVTLQPGTYISSNRSNFALCSLYKNSGSSNPANCINEFESANSLLYTYTQLSGESTTSACLTNAGNTPAGERIADYSGGSPVACTIATSCGFSQGYQTSITYNIPLNVFFVATSSPNLGGINGADNICQTAANGSGLLGTYKAFITANTPGQTIRLACTSANCQTGGVHENNNWVMYPLTTYQWSISHGIIFTTNESGIFPFGKLSSRSQYNNRIFINMWTGFKSSQDWTTPNATNSSCNGWTSAASNYFGSTGLIYGAEFSSQTLYTSKAKIMIHNVSHSCNVTFGSTGGGILCVQQ